MDVIFFLMETSNVSSKKTFFIFSIPPMFVRPTMDPWSMVWSSSPPPKKKTKEKHLTHQENANVKQKQKNLINFSISFVFVGKFYIRIHFQI